MTFKEELRRIQDEKRIPYNKYIVQHIINSHINSPFKPENWGE